MDEIVLIKICKNCKHYPLYRNNSICPVSGKRQLVNVANNCEFFEGERYKFNKSKAKTIGERPSTFS